MEHERIARYLHFLSSFKALFSGENCPKMISCEHYLNDMWLIKFRSEQDAEKAYNYLREEVREFQVNQTY